MRASRKIIYMALALAIAVSIPKKSEAAVALALAGSELFIAAGGASVVVAIGLHEQNGGWKWKDVLIASLVLLLDDKLPQTQMEHAVSNKFPFIDDPGLVKDLASAVNQKITPEAITTLKQGGNIQVSVSRQELKPIFDRSHLTPEQENWIGQQLGD